MKAGAERILYIPPEIGWYKKERARERARVRARARETDRDGEERERRESGRKAREVEGGRSNISLGMLMLIGSLLLLNRFIYRSLLTFMQSPGMPNIRHS